MYAVQSQVGSSTIRAGLLSSRGSGQSQGCISEMGVNLSVGFPIAALPIRSGLHTQVPNCLEEIQDFHYSRQA